MPSWPGVELTRPAFPGHEGVLARCEPASAAMAVAREGSRPAHIRDHRANRRAVGIQGAHCWTLYLERRWKGSHSLAVRAGTGTG